MNDVNQRRVCTQRVGHLVLISNGLTEKF